MHRNRRKSLATKRRRHRTGAVAVEFAFVAPIVFMLFFAAYEFSRVNMLRHTAQLAAYEGARRGIVPGGTSTEMADRTEQLLATAGIHGASIVATPSLIQRTTRAVEVEVSIPLDDNSWVTPFFFKSITIQRSSRLRREKLPGGP